MARNPVFITKLKLNRKAVKDKLALLEAQIEMAEWLHGRNLNGQFIELLNTQALFSPDQAVAGFNEAVPGKSSQDKFWELAGRVYTANQKYMGTL